MKNSRLAIILGVALIGVPTLFGVVTELLDLPLWIRVAVMAL